MNLYPEIKLSPCPWCGGPALIREDIKDRRKKIKDVSYYVECVESFSTAKCKMTAYTDNMKTPQEAADVWNKRNYHHALMELRSRVYHDEISVLPGIKHVRLDFIDELLRAFPE